RILRRQRCRHQQRRQELAGYATVYRYVAARKSTAKTQWWVIFLLQIVNLRATLTQGIHQMADRALFHAWLAGQHNIVAAQAQRRRQRAHRRTRVAEKQLQLVDSLQYTSIARHFTTRTIG